MLLDTPLCDFGWQAPDFSLKDPDGQIFSIRQSLGDKGLLVAFICNHCPYVQAIAERLASDTTVLINEGINVLAIMSNDYARVAMDSPEQMKAFAAQYQFPFPYLVDEGQVVGQAYGAICTPDFFGFNHKGELQYRGRLDNSHMENKPNRELELVNAIRQIAATGIGPKEQQPSMGCSIKWSNS